MQIFDAAKGVARDSYRELTLKRLYPERYRACIKAPVIPGRVVFVEVREKTLTDNFKLIRAALEKRNSQDGPTYTMEIVYLREGMESRAKVVKNCMAAIPKLARAEFIFVNEVSYLISCLPLRPQTHVIQTWHACGAFKKFGYSAVGKGFGVTREELDKYPVHRNNSYITVSSPEVIEPYAEAFNMEDQKDRFLPIGVSRTDMFFSRSYRAKSIGKTAWILRRLQPKLFVKDGRSVEEASGKEILSRMEDVYSDRISNSGLDAADRVVPGKKIILYAPTFRGHVAGAKSPDVLDLAMLKRELGDQYILLIKHHPFVKKRPSIPEDCADFAFDMTEHLTIEELLIVADLCITDYSSIIFEYSLFERPLLFFAFDMESYIDERGFYFPIEEMMPGPVCRTTAEIVSAIKEKGAEFDLPKVREFKYRFMSACDGHATARVLKLMDRLSAGETV